MSTPAPLLHPEPEHPASLASDNWKQELNARLREHRQRRAESSSAPAQNDHLHASSLSGHAASRTDRQSSSATGNATESAARVAARVAARYSKAPSYQQLLAASAAASAAAAESAALAAFEAQAAFQAHAAAQAVLSDWTDARNERNAIDCDTIGRDSADQPHGQPSDPFSDPFFTTALRPDAPDASPAPPHEWLADLPPLFVPQPSIPAPVLSVEHPEPLPPRTPVPARRMVVERARSLVDAFAEAIVPAAQSLPAKLIEFPRELVAPRKQRPRLAEGPLFEQESLSVALRIFEVGGEVGGEAGGHTGQSAQAAAPGTATIGEDAQSPVPARASRSSATQHVHRPGTPSFTNMTNRNEYDSDDSGSETTPRRRGGFLFAPDDSPQPAKRPDNPSARRPEKQTGWGSIRLGEHPAHDPIAPPANDSTLTYSPVASESAHSASLSPVSAPQARHDSEYQSNPAATRNDVSNSIPESIPVPGRADSDPAAPPLHGLAPLSDRCMSALIDTMLVASCFLLALLVFTACTTHPPTGTAALAVAFVVFGALATFYAWLFMTYGGGSTPGMRYARIALCSFADENPTRKELQNRIPATALALLPLGLGLLWALMDEDKLGWHDRMTRTYQRSYR